MKEKQKKLTFLTFSALRVIAFCACLGIVFSVYLFGSGFVRTSNAFSYSGGELAVHYLDVGQGDAIVIQLPDGRVIMMDSGTEFYYTRVKTYLTTRIFTGSDRNIDFLIATHAHDDHVGGLARLLDDFDVDIVFRPHNKSNSDYEIELALAPLHTTISYTNFITAAYTHANEVKFIEAGIEIRCSVTQYNMYFHTPTLPLIQSLRANVSGDFNDISPIISLRHKNNMFIFTGDAGLKAENNFLDCPRAREINFQDFEVYLKVAHHGSHNNTFADFLEFIKPDKAVISVGARNSHRHPRPETLARIKAAGVHTDAIFETRHLGNIVFVTDGDTERMFFAFDNKADLSIFYFLSGAFLLFLCFVNVKRI